VTAPSSAAHVPALELAAALAELEVLRRKVLEYELAIMWDTSCLSCARLLDACTAERERAGRGEERSGKLRALAARWTERDNRPAGERTAVSVTSAECGRLVLAVLDGACGECDGGLVPVSGCNCGGGGPDGYPAHEMLCGLEPCPNGCWEQAAPGPAADGTQGALAAGRERAERARLIAEYENRIAWNTPGGTDA
jgi:hypothetical protein